MAMIKHFTELRVWQKADVVAHEAFNATETFPKQYLFDLTNQLRRAALSAVTNIVEGSACVHTKELLQFLNIAQRSIRETQYLLLFAVRRGLLSASQHGSLSQRYEELHRMLSALVAALRRKL